MRRKRASTLVGLVLLGGVVFAGVTAWASGASSSRGGLVHVYEVTAGTGSTGTIVISGAITDTGIDQQGIAGNGNVNRIVLSQGTFEVNTSNIGKAFSKAKYKVNSKTCSAVAKVSAPTTAFSGTGTYKGISGTVTVTVTNAGVYPKLRNGKCNFSQRATPIGAVSFVEGSGTVSFK